MRELLASIEIPQNINVKTEFNETTTELLLDPGQIRQVFSNIITNAIQAMPEGGNLEIAIRSKDGYVCIEFKDSGKGIAEENYQRLFEPLFTTRAKGIGLGLAIAKDIIDKHKGKIKIKSHARKGTTVTITLPFGKAH